MSVGRGRWVAGTVAVVMLTACGGATATHPAASSAAATPISDRAGLVPIPSSACPWVNAEAGDTMMLPTRPRDIKAVRTEKLPVHPWYHAQSPEAARRVMVKLCELDRSAGVFEYQFTPVRIRDLVKPGATVGHPTDGDWGTEPRAFTAGETPLPWLVRGNVDRAKGRSEVMLYRTSANDQPVVATHEPGSTVVGMTPDNSTGDRAWHADNRIASMAMQQADLYSVITRQLQQNSFAGLYRENDGEYELRDMADPTRMMVFSFSSSGLHLTLLDGAEAEGPLAPFQADGAGQPEPRGGFLLTSRVSWEAMVFTKQQWTVPTPTPRAELPDSDIVNLSTGRPLDGSTPAPWTDGPAPSGVPSATSSS